MNYYEIPFAVLSEIPFQGIEVLKARILDTLEKHSGKIIKCEYWGVRSLAYKVKKQSKARYFVLSVAADSSFPENMIRYLKLAEIVLRYAIYKLDEVEEKPSEMLETLLTNPEYLKTEEEKHYANMFSSKATN